MISFKNKYKSFNVWYFNIHGEILCMSVFRKAFLYPQSAFLSLTKTLSGDSATLFKAKIELVTTKPKTRFGKTNCFLNFLWLFFMFVIRCSVSISEKLFDPLSAFLSVSSAPLKMLERESKINQCWQIENDWKTRVFSSSVIINDGDDSHLHIVIIVSFVAIFIATLISAISFFITTIMIAIFPSTVPSRSRSSFCFVF